MPTEIIWREPDMTHRERFLAVLEGKKPDKMPWVPRLDIWYNYHHNRNTLPPGYAGLSLEEIQKKLNAGRSAREGKIFKKYISNVDIKEEFIGSELHRYMVTKVGTVKEVLVKDPDFPESGYIRKEHFIKGSDDYRIMKFVEEHTRYEPDYEAYKAYDEQIGEDGFPLCIIGDIPMNTIIRDWLGYEKGYLELYDHEDEIASLNSVMLENMTNMQKIVLESPARLFLHGMHFDTQMTPPSFFKKYMVSYFQDFCTKLKAESKWLAIHEDGDAVLLLDLIKEAQIPVVDCFATYPMVSCSLRNSIRTWKDSVVIWGGIPSILLCNATVDDELFESYLSEFQKLEHEARIIAAVSDNVMPETDINRLERVSEIISSIEK